jgi:predicted transglutaminase-like cysteine proteinase
MTWRRSLGFATLGQFNFSDVAERTPNCSVPSVARPKSRQGCMMVANVISKVLSVKSATVLIAALTASAIDARPAVAAPKWLAHVLVSEVTQPPPGWVEFCVRQPSECAGPTTRPLNLVLSPKAWMDLVHVNRWVNHTIKPLTDLEHWGVVERWSYPDDGYGDCEDYVLLKRRMLIQSGWPREALLVTVVRDEENKVHAVLTVTTDKGDYVLDNQIADILPWSESGYRFLKRQSQSNPNVWVLLGDPQPAVATATSR